MRVLVLATRDWLNPSAAGGDIQMWEYASYLASRGHEITFVASAFAGSKSEEDVDGVKVVRLGGILSLWYRTFLYYMRHCRGQYDVVVAEGFGGSRIPRLTPLYVKEPLITEWHQIHRELFKAQYPRPLVPLLNLFERSVAFIHRNTLVRAGTLEWQDAFPSIGFKPGNVFLVPVSIREDWLEGGKAGQVATPTILWLGKFRRYKCPHHVIQAMKEVVREVPDARLVLAGRHDDRRYEAGLWRLVAELGLGDAVEFRFDLSEEDKRATLEEARVMVLPSSVEGFGIVVLEANARGVPVIASSGVPEGAVRHEHNGLRYRYGDTWELAQAIVGVLEDGDSYARLSANSLEFAKQFEWREVGSQYQEVVKQALGRETKPVTN